MKIVGPGIWPFSSGACYYCAAAWDDARALDPPHAAGCPWVETEPLRRERAPEAPVRTIWAAIPDDKPRHFERQILGTYVPPPPPEELELEDLRAACAFASRLVLYPRMPVDPV